LYDIPFVGAAIATIELQSRQIDTIGRTLGKAPSKEFLRAFEVILSSYERHQEAVRSSTPAAIQARIGAVVDAASELERALAKLTLTDAGVFGSIWLPRFLSNQKHVSMPQFERESLPQFLALATEALALIESEPKQGAMPAFAQRGLAASLCQILFEETGKTPTAEKNGCFDTLLRFGLDLVDDRERAAGHRGRRERRKNVKDLMQEALRGFADAAPAIPSVKVLPSLGKSPRRE